MKKNYYLILGVNSTATLEEIKAAFRRRAMELHPDHSGRESGPFLEVQEAYGVLSHPERRRLYDRQSQTMPVRTSHWPAPEPLVGRGRPEPFASPDISIGPARDYPVPLQRPSGIRHTLLVTLNDFGLEDLYLTLVFE